VLGQPDATTTTTLEHLASGGRQGAAALADASLLRRLEDEGWLERSIWQEDRLLASFVPMATGLGPAGEAVRPSTQMRLSRFAVLHARGGEAVLESPRGTGRVILHDRALGTLAVALAQGSVSLLPGLLPEAVDAVIELFVRARLLSAGEEDDDRRYAQWSLPDLLFHQRSRLGRHSNPYGASYPLAGRFESLPAIKSLGEPDVVLEPPELEAIVARDPPLQRVIEQRRSFRHHDDSTPLTLRELGELLYRAARLRGLRADGHDAPDRPHPTAGSAGELEIYPVVHLCDGIAPGLYHYDPVHHGLGLVTDDSEHVNPLLASARGAAGLDRDPQVLLVITARVGRMMFKYESLAYAAILKDVGILFHQLYLIATAMGLAPCALGGGDSEHFARATRLDPYEEPSVGEFLVGRRPVD
jgi:SagB-type dehydrogenase family enzyme